MRKKFLNKLFPPKTTMLWLTPRFGRKLPLAGLSEKRFSKRYLEITKCIYLYFCPCVPDIVKHHCSAARALIHPDRKLLASAVATPRGKYANSIPHTAFLLLLLLPYTTLTYLTRQFAPPITEKVTGCYHNSCVLSPLLAPSFFSSVCLRRYFSPNHFIQKTK